MNSKKVGYSRMFMVTPSIWELVKKCVNEHEQKLLDNLNKDTSDLKNQSKSHTSSIIHNISNRDITPLEPNLSVPSNLYIPQDEIDINQSQTSYHRSKDRSRSFLDTNISQPGSRVNVSQVPLPEDSFDQSQPSYRRSKDRSRSLLDPDNSQSSSRSHGKYNVSQIPIPDDSFSEDLSQPLNISHHSNRSKINLSQPSFDHSASFGRLPSPIPENLSPRPYIHDPEDYNFFKPKRTSSPIDRGAIIPILPLPSCKKRLPRSPVKTRSRTGVLQYIPPKLPRNDKFVCDYCNKYFARKWNLKKHVLTIHNQEISPDPNQSTIQSLKRKQPTSFTQPLFKTQKTGDFDQWKM